MFSTFSLLKMQMLDWRNFIAHKPQGIAGVLLNSNMSGRMKRKGRGEGGEKFPWKSKSKSKSITRNKGRGSGRGTIRVAGEDVTLSKLRVMSLRTS